MIANKELVFQNEEKEKRAAELLIANNKLIFQNEEKERRELELISSNKELKTMLKKLMFMTSHKMRQREEENYVPLPSVRTVSSDEIQQNYQRIKEDIQYIIYDRLGNIDSNDQNQ